MRPDLIADDAGICQDASAGAVKLFGLLKESIIGRPISEFTQPNSIALAVNGESRGKVHASGPRRSRTRVSYAASVNVLPGRHLLVLRDETAPAEATHAAPDYAFYLLDTSGTHCSLVFRGGADVWLQEQ